MFDILLLFATFLRVATSKDTVSS
ncbi:uncharacterized protein METZ01_LOCUS211543 [marine metagenome]|uniref:Uncharacterized protein n=1 Tax=marine metagenome TaxID=408172 RepID=A0A382F7P2_9ZZZZ